MQRWLLPWLLVCVYVTNVAWSPSPIGERYVIVGSQTTPTGGDRRGPRRWSPMTPSVMSSYNIGPHLSQREKMLRLAEPVLAGVLGQRGPSGRLQRFPSASVVEYMVLDMALFPPGDLNRDVHRRAHRPEEQFEVMFDEQLVMVAKRISPGPDGEDVPVNCPADTFSGPINALEHIECRRGRC